jgi:L-arabinose isomerase
LLIDDSSTVRNIKKELRFNEVYYHSSHGFSQGG